MAVVVTAASGYDLGYVWLNQGGQKSPEGYYIDAKDAEDKGRWFGPGLQELGLEQGAEVERSDYDQVYRQVNPKDGSVIGRRRPVYATKADHLARLLAAEPHATAERRIELEREAAKATRETPAYVDLTVSWSKSISLLDASIRANAWEARRDGDARSAEYWDGKLARMHEILQDANRAGMDYLQRWAGVTRTGHHGTRVEGQDRGRFEAAELVGSTWLQGTSRDGSPQDHAHNQVTREAFTVSDGKARAVDTMALRAQLGAVNAVVAACTEAGLTREFGVEWVARPDGKGNEIRGVTAEEIKLYSARTRDIEQATQELARRWEQRNGRPPNDFELQHIAQRATMRTRAGKDEGEINWDEKAEDWDAQLMAALGTRLADIAPRVSGLGGASAEVQPEPESGPPSRDKQRQAVSDAVELISSQRSTWTRADLMRTLQTVLPAEVSRMDPDLAVTLLDELTEEALSGRVAEVVDLDAPEWPPLPESLRREVDGKSVYTRPGVGRYASRTSIGLEQQLVADAQMQRAPHVTREEVARALGTDVARMDEVLHARAADARDRLPNGLRMDQGAALAHVLSSPRVVELLVGPAGTGKTRSAGEGARLWRELTGGRVIGTAVSQNATNELREAGFADAMNTTALMYALERGQVQAGTLIWLDEGSMCSMTHAARIAAYAAQHGCKVVTSGDHVQLEAVEQGGAMMLLAARLGFVQLAEPQRFTAEWEQAASLRLRDGHASALDTYQSQGRIRGGDPEQVMRQAVRAFVSEYVDGHDVILTAQNWERCRELSRQIRNDLKHLGLVDKGRCARLAEDQEASAGDLIIARKNDHDLQAGETGRGLANGDVMIVDEVTAKGLMVRRVTGVSEKTGEREYSAPYLHTDLANTDLAYATTGHAAQGSTHDAGFTVVTGTESRQWLYTAMTRGKLDNTAFVICKPRKADPRPYPLPASELKRQDAEDSFRAGLEDDPQLVEEREAIAVLSDVLDRDGTQLAALEMQYRNLSAADHLGALNAVWEDLTRGAQHQVYEEQLRAVLPPEFAGAELGSTATWLYRTLAQAEASGLDAADVVRQAVESRSLTGARDLAAVVDARIRQVVGPMIPAEPKSWTERTPKLADAELDRYVHELAGAMDNRAARLGSWTAEQQPRWLVSALGPLPEDPVARLDYENRAGKIAVYRELYNVSDPDEAIGPEPTWDSPAKRSIWHAAAMARTRADGVDLSGRSDASLWHMRRSYETLTKNAPEHPGRLLRDVRASRADAGRAAVRAEAEATAARERGDVEAAERHEARVRVCQSAEQLHGDHEGVLSVQAGLRERWSRLTEGSRLLAASADSLLRTRHPEMKIPELRSAEPVITAEEHEQMRAVTDTLATPELVGRLSARHAEMEDRLAQMATQTVPDADEAMEDEGLAWGQWMTQDSEAILQRPVEVVPPAPEIADELQFGRER